MQIGNMGTKQQNRFIFNLEAATLAVLAVCTSSTLCLAAPNVAADKKPTETKDSKDGKETKTEEKTKKENLVKEYRIGAEPAADQIVSLTPEKLVDQANSYLNKNVRFNATFYAYSNLALDYKPLMRSHTTHLSFLVKRNNSQVPLSELKLAMSIPKDERGPESKFLQDLREGDQIEVIGKVAGLPLDEPWVDVIKLKRTKAVSEDKKSGDQAAH